MDLNAGQKSMIADAMEMTGQSTSITELRRLTIRILDVGGEKYEDDLFHAGEEQWCEVDGEEVGDCEWSNVLQKARTAKRKPRSGNLDRVVQGARALFGMSGGESENVCLRCKKPGHWWRNCPLPFDKSIVFPKTAASFKSGGRKSGKPSKCKGGGSGKTKGKRPFTRMRMRKPRRIQLYRRKRSFLWRRKLISGRAVLSLWEITARIRKAGVVNTLGIPATWRKK